MLLLLTNTWLAGNKLAFFLLQGVTDRRASSGTEDFSRWDPTQKMKWPAVVVAILIGLIVGAVARRLISDKESMGIIITIILGIAGSVAGRFIASLIWKNQTGAFSPGGLLLSVLGAVLLLFLWRRVRGN